jgi:hypothetical protein
MIRHLNTYTSMTASKPKPFPDDKLQADILLSGVTTIDKPAARNGATMRPLRRCTIGPCS